MGRLILVFFWVTLTRYSCLFAQTIDTGAGSQGGIVGSENALQATSKLISAEVSAAAQEAKHEHSCPLSGLPERLIVTPAQRKLFMHVCRTELNERGVAI